MSCYNPLDILNHVPRLGLLQRILEVEVAYPSVGLVSYRGSWLDLDRFQNRSLGTPGSGVDSVQSHDSTAYNVMGSSMDVDYRCPLIGLHNTRYRLLCYDILWALLRLCRSLHILFPFYNKHAMYRPFDALPY